MERCACLLKRVAELLRERPGHYTSEHVAQDQSADAQPAPRCLLQRIPCIPSVDVRQAGWLLLASCATPRANYILRILNPTPHAALSAPQLAQRFGGLGLRSGRRRESSAGLSCPEAR
ncbi:unnamed protein product [Symbiodinium natans]|uniref:Uncharacterized protein n=1 Tax=Symbiodinium natans TaxID=878477 RepID=A0A812T289_9DINO|nr:unnamed protein product [Symbiodinium natans]